MINEDFLEKFGKAHGVFLPYVISDHSPAVLVLPDGLHKKKRSFRFVNYVADKSEFMKVVDVGWNKEVYGCRMYQVVQKLKMLKKTS